MGLFDKLFGKAKNGLRDMSDNIEDLLSPQTPEDKLKKGAERAFREVGNVGEDLSKLGSHLFNGNFEEASGKVDDIGKGFARAGKKLGKSVDGGIISDIKEALSELWEAIKDALSKLVTVEKEVGKERKPAHGGHSTKYQETAQKMREKYGRGNVKE